VLKQESEPGNNDGLAFRVVTSIDIDEDGDVWFGTFKGLTWWDGKTFRNFRMPEGQKPSDPEPKGLVNNVIYGVTHQGPDIWVATTDGTSVYNKMTDTWKTWYLNNSPMEETWCYGISSSPDKIWLAAWGAGLMEYTISKDHWNAYHDPDGSFNVDLLRNDGMLSMMSVSASYDAGAVWTASYFGVTRYDGKDFRDWDQDHGLPSNFVNFVKARGENAWIATDKGLAVYAGDKWYTYARSRGEGDTHGTLTEVGSEGKNGRVFRTASAIPHDFVWGMDFDADGGIWVTTSDGVALAAGEINAHSRETGLRVELVVVDDEADMSAAGDRLVDLIYTHEVNAIIGAINSAVTHVVQMVAAKTHVPMITTTSTDPSITRAGSYYTFRCLPDDLLQGRALADRLFRIDGRRHVALLRQDNRYGKMGGSEIARIAKAKGRPLMSDAFFDGKAERFDREVDALRRAGPDALVIWGLYKPAGLLVKALRDAGLSFPVYGADGMAHPGFLEHAKDAADGVVMTFPFDPCRDDPVTRAFLERFRERFGYEADSFAAHSYDAMMIIWSAIRHPPRALH